jgi:hypothetical protein
MVGGSWSLTLKAQEPLNDLRALQGGGTLEGVVTSDGIRINLHPGLVDHNVNLHLGRPDGGTMRGSWQFVSDAGVEVEGSVELRAAAAPTAP